MKEELELTILMPCLNEAKTLEICIKKAFKSLEENNINGEVLISDNGSTDGSKEIAKRCGARIIEVETKGYGSALIEGIKAANGKFIIMGDSDDSYDFSNIMPFVEKLREGYELVMGNRYKGGIEKGAMPWSHKYIGTPVISFIGRVFYKTKIRDFNCGIRGLNRKSILKLDLKTTGMEYASEMIIRASLNKLKIAEVPTTLKKDGRERAPHLKSFRDGWRHLKVLLVYSPRYMFLIPGIILIFMGILGFIVTNMNIKNIHFGIHTMLYCGAMIVLGFQTIIFGILAKVHAINSGMHPKTDKLTNLLRKITTELGIILGIIFIIIGFILSGLAINKWKATGYGNLNPLEIMPLTIPAVDLLIIGVELIFASFLLGVLNIKSKK